MTVYAIIDCPNCGREELKVKYYMKTAIRGGRSKEDEPRAGLMHFGLLQKSFDKGPIPCAKCGGTLSLHKPEGAE